MADVTDLLRAARQALARGDHERALPLVRQAVDIGPEIFGAHMLLGVCLAAAGKQGEGIRALERALQLNPNSAQGRYNLGAALQAAGRFAEAERHFAAALRLDPGYRAAAAAIDAVQARSRTRVPAAASEHRAVTGRGRRPPPSSSLRGRARPGRRRARVSSQTQGRALRAPALQLGAEPRLRPRGRLVPYALGKWALIALAGAVIAAAGGQSSQPGRARAIVWQRRTPAAAIDFSADGSLLAVAGVGVTLRRASDGKRIAALGRKDENIVQVAVSPDGEYLASTSLDERAGAEVKLWRIADRSLVGALPANSGRRPLAFSPDGKHLAVGTDYLGPARPLGVQLWSLPDLQLVRAVAQPEQPALGYVSAIAFSPDGKLIAAADDAGAIRISRVRDGVRIKTIQTDSVFGLSLAFSPDGTLLAHGGMSGPSVILSRVPDGERISVLGGDAHRLSALGRPPAVNDLDFSPDGHLLAASESTGDLARIEIFRLSDAGLVRTIEAGPAPGRAPRLARGARCDVRHVRFSPTGEYLAWCGSAGVAVARVADCLS